MTPVAERAEIGPSVTKYEVKLKARVNRTSNLADDLALGLGYEKDVLLRFLFENLYCGTQCLNSEIGDGFFSVNFGNSPRRILISS